MNHQGDDVQREIRGRRGDRERQAKVIADATARRRVTGHKEGEPPPVHFVSGKRTKRA